MPPHAALAAAPLAALAAPEEAITPTPSPRREEKRSRRLAWIGGAVATVLVLSIFVIIGPRAHGPVIGKIDDQKASQGQTLQLSIPLIDRGSFPDRLQYRWNNPLPPGPPIGLEKGLFTWNVPKDQAAAPYPITVQVAVAGREDLSSEATFVVQVSQRAQPPAAVKIEKDKAVQGQTVRVSEKPNLDVGDAVYLIEVEISGRLIPFATCCAVNEKTLLTSAREAAQLVYMRKYGLEQRILIRNEKGVKREVEEIRALRTFSPLFAQELIEENKKSARAQEEPVAENKPPKWLYFDLALLTVEEKLPAFAPLASSEDLKALEDGLPLLCRGYAHDTKMMSKDKVPALQFGESSIYLITTIPPSDLPPGVNEPPRLLHMDGEIPTQWVDDPNAAGDDHAAKRKVAVRPYGSPVFNRQGKLVAVYGDTPPKGEKPMLLHLAPVVSPKLIDRWLRGEANQTEDIETWKLPDVFSPPPKSSRKP